MFGRKCCSSCFDTEEYEEMFSWVPKPYVLPAPLPQWPQGRGFGTGKICLGEIEVVQITNFETIYSCKSSWIKSKGITFYRPVIPAGYFCLGHYCQPDDEYVKGYLLAARYVDGLTQSKSPPLAKPFDYTLVWSTGSRYDGHSGFIWLPNPPAGYKSMGFVVTNDANQPDLPEVRCVRADLTEPCEAGESIFGAEKLSVWTTRPCKRGMFGKGVAVGTFFCSALGWTSFCHSFFGNMDELNIACLKNLDTDSKAMPNLDQIHALIKHYGPTVFFHPDELYLPSSVAWFFQNGALLYKDGKDAGLTIDSIGSNLPSGGENDGQFWLDLGIKNAQRNYIMSGNMESAELYVHVKPALGGSFTDIAMWIFCPFNGPATLKAGLMTIPLNRVGEHVGDWEHFTLRISNFTGELYSVFFSEHSGGEWVHVSELEFVKETENKLVVYSSKNGHASFPHAGCYIQGSSKLGVGARNDCDRSKYSLDSSVKYELVAAEYLGEAVVAAEYLGEAVVAAEYLGEAVVAEPPWLQYMREWGPRVVYDSRSEVDKIISHLPFFVRFTVESLFELFPTELYGEEGPTGPKEKDNWLGDERC